jgi:hypothetical protein
MAIQRSSVISRTRNTAAAPADVSEFDGLWLNIGVSMGDSEDDSNFVRLPRGVAVGDLKTKKVYDRQIAENPEYAAEVQLMNNLITLIQEKSLTLEEGESVPMKLEVVLYRRQEASDDVAPTKQDLSALEAAIF